MAPSLSCPLALFFPLLLPLLLCPLATNHPSRPPLPQPQKPQPNLQWLVRSRRLASPRAARPRASSSPPRLPASRRPPPVRFSSLLDFRFMRKLKLPLPLLPRPASLATGPFSPRAPSRSRRARVRRGSEENGARESEPRERRKVKRASEREISRESQKRRRELPFFFFFVPSLSDLIFFSSQKKRKKTQAASRSPTVTAPERSRSARSASTRSRPTS